MDADKVDVFGTLIYRVGHLLLQADIDSVIKNVSKMLKLCPNKIKAGRDWLSVDWVCFNGVRVELKSEDSVSDLRKIFREADDQLAVDPEGSVVTAVLMKPVSDITDKTIAQSIEVVSRRVNGTGTKEPIIQRQGDDRILVQLPGMNDPKRVKELLDKTAQLSPFS